MVFFSPEESRNYLAQAAVWSCWRLQWFALEGHETHSARHGLRMLSTETEEAITGRSPLKASLCALPVREDQQDNSAVLPSGGEVSGLSAHPGDAFATIRASQEATVQWQWGRTDTLYAE